MADIKNIDEYWTIWVQTNDPDSGDQQDADAVPSYRIYEETTDTNIGTGNLAKQDDANTLGFYVAQVQLTTANGYEAGKSYVARITATVSGSQSSPPNTVTAATLRYLNVIDAPTVDEMFLAFMKRDWTGITGESMHSMFNALRMVLNKWGPSSPPGFIHVYKENESDVAFSKAVGTDAGAEPINETGGPG